MVVGGISSGAARSGALVAASVDVSMASTGHARFEMIVMFRFPHPCAHQASSGNIV
jgi:hypothetical protein